MPDDIRSPPPYELQQRREGLDETKSLFEASVQAIENGPYRQVRHLERTDGPDDMENASPSEQRTYHSKPLFHLLDRRLACFSFHFLWKRLSLDLCGLLGRHRT